MQIKEAIPCSNYLLVSNDLYLNHPLFLGNPVLRGGEKGYLVTIKQPEQGEVNDPSNYRRISIVSIISKVLEIILRDQFENHLKVHVALNNRPLTKDVLGLSHKSC